MRKMVIFCVVLGMIMIFNGAIMAADQTVTFEVTAINEIGVSGNPGALTVSTATAGSQPTAATDASTTYAITTNEGGAKIITGQINSAMPANTTLSVNLSAPSAGGSSAGSIDLTTGAQNLVTAIPSTAESGIGISYTFSATAAAGVVASDTRIVTLTLTN